MTDLATILHSPLTQVERNSIDELLARDPLQLTDQDLDLLVDYFRQLRKDVRQAEAEKTPRKTKAKGKEALTSGANISLDDLLL